MTSTSRKHISPDGRVWTHAGTERYITEVGRSVNLTLWTTPCRHCGKPIMHKTARYLREDAFSRAPLNCSEHAGWPSPEVVAERQAKLRQLSPKARAGVLHRREVARGQRREAAEDRRRRLEQAVLAAGKRGLPVYEISLRYPAIGRLPRCDRDELLLRAIAEGALASAKALEA
jgi:hypothetical protein